jgi:translation initiation factor 4G
MWAQDVNARPSAAECLEQLQSMLQKKKAEAPAGGETEEEKTKRVMTRARLVLNKLSTEKTDKLSGLLVGVILSNVSIGNGVILAKIIDLVVEKAQGEPHFAAMYSDLCMKLSTTPLPGLEDDSGGKAKLFRKQLLTKCQVDFEGEPEAVKLARPKWAQMRAEGLMTDEDLNLKEIWAKKCGLGHICFIGELYNRALLSDRIMHECVIRLFGDVDNPDEEDLECLCKLMGTVGKRMEATEDSNYVKRIKKYYSEVKRLSSDQTKGNNLSTRSRFLLKDLLDLRANRYVSRRKEEKAMSLAQVHAEVMREEARNGGGNNYGKGGKGKGDRDGKGGKGGRKGGAADRSGILARLDSYKNQGGGGGSNAPKKEAEVDADGWAVVSAAPKKPGMRRDDAPRERDRDRRSDRDRDRERRRDRDRDDGGGAGGAFAALMGGSGKKDRDRNRRRDGEDRERRRDKDGEGRDRDRERRRDKEGGRERDRERRRDKKSKDGPRSPQSGGDEEEFTSLADVLAAQGGGGGGGKTMDKDKFKQKCKSILQEFYAIQDMKEATLCLNELEVPDMHW